MLSNYLTTIFSALPQRFIVTFLMLSRHFRVTSLAFLQYFLGTSLIHLHYSLSISPVLFWHFLTHPRYCFSTYLTLHWCFLSTPLIECEPLFHQSYTPIVCFLKKHCFLSRYVCCTSITAYAQHFCHFHAPVVCFFAKATCLLSTTSSTFFKRRVFASRARALVSFFRIFPHITKNAHRVHRFAYKPHSHRTPRQKAKKEQKYKAN